MQTSTPPGHDTVPLVQFIPQLGAPVQWRMHCAPFMQATLLHALVCEVHVMSQRVPLP